MEKVKVFQKGGGGGGGGFGNIYSKISQNSRPVEGSSMAGDHNDAYDRTYPRDLKYSGIQYLY